MLQLAGSLEAVKPKREIAALILIAAMLVAASAANAQAPYQGQPFNRAPVFQPALPYQAQPEPQPQPYRQAPAAAPSWNYDPYTDGTVPTPRGGSG